MNKTALISGITGQDGSYLAELLLKLEYKIVGLHRRTSVNNFERINHLLDNPKFKLEEFDLTDPSICDHVVNYYQPDEFYNLAAQSHVGTSFKQPSTTFQIDTIGTVNVLESIRKNSQITKFYQASTSEMFGRNFSTDKDGVKYQDENTELLPQSPYGVAKLAAHRLVQIYREAYGIFAVSGILFNHESPRRGEQFVTRKITRYLGQLVNHNIKETLKLGNLNASRDWGHAKDYVNAMFLMLQNDSPQDYVICTGKTHTVLDFLKAAFEHVNLDYTKHVEIDPDLYRPAEVDYLCGRNNKAKKELKWFPQIGFEDLVKDMVISDVETFTHA